jgi:5-methylcytosine-specific restriction endonuclease McrA
MFDYDSQSIEEARDFGRGILDAVKSSLPAGFEALYAHGIVNVVRVVKKDPGVGKALKVITVGTMPVADLFACMDRKSPPPVFEFEGVQYKARLRSHRLRCFKHNPRCVVCDVEGTEARLERNWTHEPGKAHWNVYGRNATDHWVLMTVDHIIPLSKGGPDHPDNFQTMCSRCNAVKSDDKLMVEQVRQKLKLPHSVRN